MNSIYITAIVYIISQCYLFSHYYIMYVCFTHILTLHCNLFCISHEITIYIKLYAIAIPFYTVKHIVILRLFTSLN